MWEKGTEPSHYVGLSWKAKNSGWSQGTGWLFVRGENELTAKRCRGYMNNICFLNVGLLTLHSTSFTLANQEMQSRQKKSVSNKITIKEIIKEVYTQKCFHKYVNYVMFKFYFKKLKITLLLKKRCKYFIETHGPKTRLVCIHI